jgi:hypothetical protein
MKHDMTEVVGRNDLPFIAVDTVAKDMYNEELYNIMYNGTEYKVYNHNVKDWDTIGCLANHMANLYINSIDFTKEFDAPVEVDEFTTFYVVVKVFTFYAPHCDVEVHYVSINEDILDPSL